MSKILNLDLILNMNQCYTLPEKLTNHEWYEDLRKNIERKFEERIVSITTIVPKKTARCIFVEKGKRGLIFDNLITNLEMK